MPKRKSAKSEPHPAPAIDPSPATAIDPPGRVTRTGDRGTGGAMAQLRRRLKLSDDVNDATVARDALAAIDSLEDQLNSGVPDPFRPEPQSMAAQL